MTPFSTVHGAELAAALAAQLEREDLAAVSALLTPAEPSSVAAAMERLPSRPRAIAFRLLPKDTAVAVLDRLDASMQADLVRALQDDQVAVLFAEMDPDDRVQLLDELPAGLASRLLRGLSRAERDMTAAVLAYPSGSIGRRMTPEYVTTRHFLTVDETLARVRDRLDDAESVYVIPVLDDARQVIGMVELRDLIAVDPETVISTVMGTPQVIRASDPVATAARHCAELGLPAVPVVDEESRLVGMVTIDDAVRVLEFAETGAAARQGGSEPLRQPYLVTSIWSVVRSRLVWLLVLAIGATLTVKVLDVFEATLAQVTVLALFVPLLIGTGGNTGNQAATTVTRALALGDVRPNDLLRVISRELRVGASLGVTLGLVGCVATTLFHSWPIGIVIGLTLVAICTLAAVVGGAMPLAARAIGVDPAVFSNPFITTFVDASGLIVYFLIARAVLGLA